MIYQVKISKNFLVTHSSECCAYDKTNLRTQKNKLFAILIDKQRNHELPSVVILEFSTHEAEVTHNLVDQLERDERTSVPYPEPLFIDLNNQRITRHALFLKIKSLRALKIRSSNDRHRILKEIGDQRHQLVFNDLARTIFTIFLTSCRPPKSTRKRQDSPITQIVQIRRPTQNTQIELCINCSANK